MVVMNNIKYWFMVIGGGLIFYGLTQRSLKGAAFIFGGGYLVYYGLTGQRLFNREEGGQLEAESSGRFEQRTQRQLDETIDPADVVDVAVWETFPASDPPAWMATG
jgi:uncharacterized membrane protein